MKILVRFPTKLRAALAEMGAALEQVSAALQVVLRTQSQDHHSLDEIRVRLGEIDAHLAKLVRRDD